MKYALGLKSVKMKILLIRPNVLGKSIINFEIKVGSPDYQGLLYLLNVYLLFIQDLQELQFEWVFQKSNLIFICSTYFKL